MSGLMNKVKDALSGDKHNTNTSTGGTGSSQPNPNSKPERPMDRVINISAGLENEHGTQSGVHDTPIGGSVAHGSSVSPTNPGVLHSTERGIHGDRDPGVSGSGLSNQDTTGQSGLGGGSSALGGGTGAGYDDTTTTTRDTGLGGDSGMSAGPQFTGTGERDAGLVQSGVDSTRREGGGGMTGSGYDDTRDTGLTGSGSGYDNTRDTGLTGSGSGYDNTRDTGLTGTGSGYDNTRDLSGSTGTGLNDGRAGYDSGATGGSGLTGTGYDESTRGTGTSGSGYDSGMTGSGSGMDSGMTGNTSTGTGLTGGAERYVEGSEKHHPGDGHPEDIVHPGPHETMTAKALDPHLNQ